MNSVFILQHEYHRVGCDEVKFLGVYSSRALAEAAIERLRLLDGFCDTPDGFEISECEVDATEWESGFSCVAHILVPTVQGDPTFHVVGSEWRPGDVFKIFDGPDDGVDPDSLQFKVGDLVRCAPRVVNGEWHRLVASSLAEADT